MKKTILLVGGSGNIGEGILKYSNNTDVNFLTSSRDHKYAGLHLDPFDSHSLLDCVHKYGISTVFLLSGMSDVQACQDLPKKSYKANVELPYSIAKILASTGVHLITCSSEYVYDGSIDIPKTEQVDNICPQNIYGKHKYLHESIVLNAYSSTTVLRLPKVYGDATKKDFLAWIVDSISNNKPIRVARDQIFSPITTRDLAVIAQLIDCIRPRGIFNCGGPDAASRYSYFQMVENILGTIPIATSATMDELGVSNLVPKNVSMDSSLLYNLLDFQPCSFSSYVREYASEIRRVINPC